MPERSHGEDGVAVDVRVGVERHVDPGGLAPRQVGQQGLGATAVVRDVDRDLSHLAKRPGLVHAWRRSPVVAAQVTDVRCSDASSRPAQSRQLVEVGEHTGHVLQAGGHTDGALLQALLDQSLHRPQPVARRTVLGTQHLMPYRAERNEVRHVDRRTAVVEAQQTRHRAAAVRTQQLRWWRPGNGCEVPRHVVDRRGGSGRERQPVLPEDHRCHTLSQHGELDVRARKHCVRVNVGVDEAGHDQPISRIHDRRGAGAVEVADRLDRGTPHADVGAVGCAAGPIDDRPADDQQVVGTHVCTRSMISSTKPRWPARMPPSTRSTTPVIHAASSEARKAIAAATSSGSPTRPSG